MRVVWLALVVLVACAPIQGIQRQQQITGTEAITLSFRDVSPTKLRTCETGVFLVDVHNKGLSDVELGSYVFILDDQMMTDPSTPKTGMFRVQGRSQYNTFGGLSQLEVRAKSKPLAGLFSQRQTDVIVRACYPYVTRAQVNVCVDTDVRGENPKKVCKAGIVSMAQGQGAPVVVTRVESLAEPVGNGIIPQFAIYLHHQGTGNVIPLDSVPFACGERSPLVDLSPKLQVSAFFRGEYLDCDRNVTLSPNEVELICRTKQVIPKSEGTFTSLLNIEASYGYETQVSYPLTIERGSATC